MTRRLLLVAFGLVGLLASSCSGGAGKPVPPCHVPDSIQSYRVTITAKMDMPGLDEALEELGSPNDPDKLAPWLLGLADMRLEGAVVLPDRVQLAMMYSGGPFDGLDVAAVLIDDREWVKDNGSGWEESTPYPEGLAPLTDLCTAANLPEEMAIGAQDETVNGVVTNRYRLDEAQFKYLGSVLIAEDVQANWDAAGLRHEGTIDYWLAQDGNWPVRVEGRFTLDYEQIRDLKLSVAIDVKDVNDPRIRIGPPVTD